MRYSHSARPSLSRDLHASAAALSEQMAHTVVYYSSAGHGILLLPAGCKVDFETVQKRLSLKFARPDPEAMLPGCEPGTMPPFGGFFGLPVLMDERLAHSEYVAFPVGAWHDVIRMRTADLIRLIQPQIEAFSY